MKKKLDVLVGKLRPEHVSTLQLWHAMGREPVLSREDGICDSGTMTAIEIDRKVRALTPWPGVTLTVDRTLLKVLETALEATADSIPILCKGESTLHLITVQAPGGKPLSAKLWKNGRHM